MKKVILFLSVYFFIVVLTAAQTKQLFLIAGQSNAVGQGDSTKSVVCKAGTAFEFDANVNAFIPLKDPVGKNWKLFQRAQTGCVAPAFAQRFNELTNNTVYIVTAARGGASCHEKAEMANYGTWSETGKNSLFEDAVSKTSMAMKTSGLPLSGIIWLQGERDANAIHNEQLTAQEYQQALESVIGRFRAKLGKNVPFYIVLTGNQTDRTSYGTEAVRQVQIAVAKKIDNVYIAYTETPSFPNRGWLKDNIHYAQRGLNEIGNNIAETVFRKKSLDLESLFLNPPVKARPYVWWHWMGPNFSKQGITKDLEAMKAMGIGGATIFNISSAVQESHVPTLNNPWPNQTYRSDAYWEALRFAASEAQRLGLEIGLHNTAGYSTTGGPWIDQERGMKKLVWRKAFVKNGTTNILIPKPDSVYSEGWGSKGLPRVYSTWYKDIAYLAIAAKDSATYQNCEDFTNFFDEKGHQKKALPKGDWIVYRMGFAPTMSIPHPLPDDIMFSSMEADKMSKEQSAFHWDNVLNPFKTKLGDYLGKSFNHMLIDSYEAGYQNWTPGFREEFIKRKGYDPMPWLLTFVSSITNSSKNKDQRVKENQELTERFNWDYKDVINRLYNENGWQIGKKKLHEAGLDLQFEAYGGPFNTVESSALADIPMGEFWSGGKGRIGNQITGAARAAGRTIVGAEAFTGSPSLSQFTEDPAFLKPSSTGAFASGINRLILHHWVHQPFDDKYQPGMGMGWWGTHFGRHQTWAEPGKAFFSYLTRTQTLLQYGEQQSDYLAIETPVDETCDVISVSDFLRQNIKVQHGLIYLESGRAYPILVLPKSAKILPEILVKVKALVVQGAVVVMNKPTQSYSLQNYPQCDSLVASIVAELFEKPAQNQLRKGFVFSELKAALSQLAIAEDCKTEQAESPGEIKYVHRSGYTGDVYFIANLSNKPQHLTLSFRRNDCQPELWNAETGAICDAPVWSVKQGRTFVELKLNDFQTIFVVFRKPTSTQDHITHIRVNNPNADWNLILNKKNQPVLIANQSSTAEVLYVSEKSKTMKVSAPDVSLLSGDWQVAFRPKMDSLFHLNFSQLSDFSLSSDPRVKYFAGTATYTKTIQIDKSQLKHAQAIQLDLGTLNDIVSVRLNGLSLGVYWYPPYVVDVTNAIKAGDNKLEIAVTNNWANRLIGDEQEPADFEWGNDRGKQGHAMKSYPDWFLKNEPRPSAGRKTFSVWYYYRKDSPLQPAGLVGPVKLSVYKTAP